MEENSISLDSFKDWIDRFKRIKYAYDNGFISDEDLEKYQLFLLDFGHFNANFTKKELLYLKYPLSPFAKMDRHSYLRSTETWAMEILRTKYIKEEKRKLYPIWLDSELFWGELNRYCRVVKVDDNFETKMDKKLNEYNESQDSQMILFEIDKNDFIEKKDYLKKLNKKIKDYDIKIKYYYYFKDKFQGIETIVFCNQKNKIMEFESIIGNLGYRIDPVRIIRIILRKYFPKFIVDKDQTQEFWNIFMRIQKNTKLNYLFNDLLNDLFNDLFSNNFDIQLYKDLDKKSLKHYTINKFNSMNNSLNIYIEYIDNFISEFKNYLSSNNNEGLKLITYPEIINSIDTILKACYDNNIEKVVRYTQVITEIMLLYLDHNPLTNFPFQYSINEKIKNEVFISSYAMRSFVNIFQILENCFSNPTKISITNQSYFELLHNMERLNKNKYNISTIRHLKELDSSSNIIFTEIHPNNVIQYKQFSQDISWLINNIKNNWTPKKRAIVIDITLNNINDNEITELLKQASDLINSGWLTIILIQSLTKFSQLGLDKRSAGLISIFYKNEENEISNFKNWDILSFNIKNLKQEKVDETTIKYFSYFSNYKTLTLNYIDQINKNVRYLYRKTMNNFKNLNITDRSYFQITMNSDEKACYIALNLNGFISNENFSIDIEFLNDILKKILNNLILPLCKIYNLPITERMSIGFPLSSINLVYDSLRFTIGLESKEQLDYYSEILTYVSFILNRPNDKKIFYGDLCINYFKEKVEQFEAMIPGRRKKIEFTVKDDNSSIKKKAIMDNGKLIIENVNDNIEFKISAYIRLDDIDKYKLKFNQMEYNFPKIVQKEILIYNEKISDSIRRLIASCLSKFYRISNISLTSMLGKNMKYDMLIFENFAYMGTKDLLLIKGPFFLEESELNIIFYNSIFNIIWKDKIFNEDKIYIKQDDIIIPLLDIPIDDIEFFFKDTNPNIQYRNKIIPKLDPTRFIFENDKLIIERDFICCKNQSISIYVRYLGNNSAYYEIYCWRIKDPVLALFIRRIIAEYVAIQIKAEYASTQVNCDKRDDRFTHIKFSSQTNLNFEYIQSIFEIAIDIIDEKKDELIKLIKENKEIDIKNCIDNIFQ